MPDFLQQGIITTLHDFGIMEPERREQLLERATRRFPIGLVLPVTAEDSRAEPFQRIVNELTGIEYIDKIVVALGVAPDRADYTDTVAKIAPLGERGNVLWTDGPRVQSLYSALVESGLNLSVPGKGRSVWTAFGYLLADPKLKAFALHDCDIVHYTRDMLVRLCLPLAARGLNYEFCKAYYARFSDRFHGRVVRLLVSPILSALMATLGPDRFLRYLNSFRYPLSGEFAVTADLARSNRIPGDWGLEIGTLAEVYRNTSVKRVCQVDLCPRYDHKHSPLSVDKPEAGLMKMATDILVTLFRTLGSMGFAIGEEHFVSLRSAYVRKAQDSIRTYHADSLINGLIFDRHAEEEAVEAFANRIMVAAETYRNDPVGHGAIPNWGRVLAVLPDFPEQLVQAVDEDAAELS